MDTWRMHRKVTDRSPPVTRFPFPVSRSGCETHPRQAARTFLQWGSDLGVTGGRRAAQRREIAMPESLRKSYKYKLKPTPEQERALTEVLWRCRTLYNTALEQRINLYRQWGASISRYSQEAELKDLRAELPEYAAIHSHVLQDVLARLDKTYQAFFRRVANGENAGFPRSHGRDRYHSFTYKEYGNGARLDNGYLVLRKTGRGTVRWSRPI